MVDMRQTEGICKGQGGRRVQSLQRTVFQRLWLQPRGFKGLKAGSQAPGSCSVTQLMFWGHVPALLLAQLKIKSKGSALTCSQRAGVEELKKLLHLKLVKNQRSLSNGRLWIFTHYDRFVSNLHKVSVFPGLYF